MDEPLPRWAKAFVALMAGLLVLSFVVWKVALDDGLSDPEPAHWRVDPSARLDADSLRVPVIINENECASGRSAEGRIRYEVEYQPDAVTIDIGVRPLRGDRNCPGNPDTPYVVKLREPLGNRSIAGERWPPPG